MENLSSNIANSDFLYNPGGEARHCHCPTILQTQSGDLLVTWYAYPEQEHEGATLAIARRRNGQTHWEKSQTIGLPESYSLGNPVLFQLPQGRIWLLFAVLNGGYWDKATLNGIWSDDGGKTWAPPIPIWQNPGMMVRHPPLLLGGHSLLLPAYDEKLQTSILLTSVPPYKKWQEVHRFADLKLIQPVLIKDDSQRLSIFFRPVDRPRVIWRSHSIDQGRSWSVPMRTPLPNPLSGIAAFAWDNSTAVVHNHTHEHQRYPLSISITRDGGTTWENPIHFDTSNHEVSYPSFISGANGLIHGVYTYNRRFIKYVSFNKDQFL